MDRFALSRALQTVRDGAEATVAVLATITAYLYGFGVAPSWRMAVAGIPTAIVLVLDLIRTAMRNPRVLRIEISGKQTTLAALFSIVGLLYHWLYVAVPAAITTVAIVAHMGMAMVVARRRNRPAVAN